MDRDVDLLSMEMQRPNIIMAGHRTIRLRQLRNFPAQANSNFENTAKKIVDELEQDEELIAEGQVSEQLRQATIKGLPYTLTMKRCIKEHLSRSVQRRRKVKHLSYWTYLKYKTKQTWSKFKDAILNLEYLNLWKGGLKEIEGRFGSSYASYFKFLRWIFLTNILIAVLPLLVLVIPQIIYTSTLNSTNNVAFKVDDIFTGSGYFGETVLFYGHYSNKTFDLISGVYFNMPAAYFGTFAVLYLVALAFLCISVATSYNRSYIETEGGLKNMYASKIFCGWDYAIATEEAARLKSFAIYNELKELLNDSLHETVKTSFCSRMGLLFFRCLINGLILTVFGLLGWSLWLLLDLKLYSQEGGVIVTAVVANLIMSVIPSILSVVTRWESYKNPKTALNVNLVRTFLLGFSVVAVILGYWLTNDSRRCWETQLGQEIYRLVIFDTVISIVMTLVEVGIYCGRRLFTGKAIEKTEFNIARHTLHIIYNQTLFWVGLFYSPLLPLIVAAKVFLLWYIRTATLRLLCAPPKRLWRDAHTHTWFRMMAFASLACVVIAQAYTMHSVRNSIDCGPFAQYNYTYEILLGAVQDVEDASVVWRILGYLFKPGVLVFIMIAISVVVYYFKEQSLAEKERVRTLRLLLQWTAKDKEYLINYYNKVVGNTRVKQNQSNIVNNGPGNSQRNNYRETGTPRNEYFEQSGSGMRPTNQSPSQQQPVFTDVFLNKPASQPQGQAHFKNAGQNVPRMRHPPPQAVFPQKLDNTGHMGDRQNFPRSPERQDSGRNDVLLQRYNQYK